MICFVSALSFSRNMKLGSLKLHRRKVPPHGLAFPTCSAGLFVGHTFSVAMAIGEEEDELLLWIFRCFLWGHCRMSVRFVASHLLL